MCIVGVSGVSVVVIASIVRCPLSIVAVSTASITFRRSFRTAFVPLTR